MAASYTLTKTGGTRTFTLQELNALSFRLLPSGLSFQKSGDLVYYILDQHGRMLIQELGPNFYPGQALFEAYTPSWSTSQPFNTEACNCKALANPSTLTRFKSCREVLVLAPTQAQADGPCRPLCEATSSEQGSSAGTCADHHAHRESEGGSQKLCTRIETCLCNSRQKQTDEKR